MKPLVLLLVLSGPLLAQAPDAPVRVAVGFGVDTTSPASHDIFSLWSTYLRSRPNCTAQSPAWVGPDLL